jgi:hypothetical protein
MGSRLYFGVRNTLKHAVFAMTEDWISKSANEENGV